MTIHLTAHSLYWLLPVLFVGLLWWVFAEREDERATSFMPDLGPLFRLLAAAGIFLLVLVVVLAFNLWQR